MLPNFFIIGAQKAATTSLYRYLEGHPAVGMARVKEPEWFTGFSGLSRSEYESLWSHRPDAAVRGEASTQYSMFPSYHGVPERLTTLVPEPKLIYILRHPIERMRSAYHHSLALGLTRYDMLGELLTDARYLNASQYALQLEQWLPFVPKDRILCVSYEELVATPASVTAAVLRFLGVDETSPVDTSGHHHRSEDKRAPRAAVRRTGQFLQSRNAWGPHAAAQLREYVRTGNSYLTRPIAAHELVMGAELRELLTIMVRPDLERLRTLLGQGWDWGLLPTQIDLTDDSRALRRPAEPQRAKFAASNREA